MLQKWSEVAPSDLNRDSLNAMESQQRQRLKLEQGRLLHIRNQIDQVLMALDRYLGAAPPPPPSPPQLDQVIADLARQHYPDQPLPSRNFGRLVTAAMTIHGHKIGERAVGRRLAQLGYVKKATASGNVWVAPD